MSIILNKISEAIIIALLVLLFTSGCSDPKGGNSNGLSSRSSEKPHIEVHVQGVSGGQASLIGTIGDQNYRVASTDIDSEGRFEFVQDSIFLQGAYFIVLPDNSNFQILISEDQEFSMNTHIADLVNAMSVDGSIDNQLYYESLKIEMTSSPRLQEVLVALKTAEVGSEDYKRLRKEQDDINSKHRVWAEEKFAAYPNTLFTSFKRAGQNPEIKEFTNADGTVNISAQVAHYRNEFWNGVDFSDDRLLRTPVIYNKLNRYITELTIQHPDSLKKSISFIIDKAPAKSELMSFFVNWIALKYEPTKTTLMDAEAIYVYMVQNYITKEKAFWADAAQIQGLQQRANEMSASLIGLQGPEVQAPDPNGNILSISSITTPYIIVYLYNPECDHCREETPKLVDLYHKTNPKEFEVYAIAIDTNADQWKSFIKEYRMDWINVFDPTNRSIYGKYYVDNTPEIYVLNPQRKIIAKNLNVDQIFTMINKDKNPF